MFIWYGGLLKMGELLNATGVTTAFATAVGAMLGGLGWFTVLVLVLFIYFVTHYFFASITAHMLALFPPFVALLISVGVPPTLAVYSLMCLTNLPAGLTHYGTTTGPILFSQGYVTLRRVVAHRRRRGRREPGDLAHHRPGVVARARLLVAPHHGPPRGRTAHA